MNWLLAVAAAAVSIPAGLRWLRIAQREHYLAPATTRFAWRWWTISPVNSALLAAAVAGVLASFYYPGLALVTVLAQVGPVGLRVRGSTSPLVWTSRLRRLAAVAAGLALGVYGLGAFIEASWLIAAGLVGLPLLVDIALVLLKPVEERLGRKWVDRAARKLKTSGVEVVAITGSYGKTTTKGYVAHLLSGVRRTLASPASFNNRMGLARAINENLTPDTEVFVAEMGTYAPGEIAALCQWIPPKVSALVAVGPVHLERFRTEERIVEAKAEIFEEAEVGVICVDDPRLAALATRLGETMEIVEVSTGDQGRVRVTPQGIFLDGRLIASPPDGVFEDNLAVALGICVALGVDLSALASRLADLPAADHRQTVIISQAGFSIIDDTFNSNPAGARRALELLQDLGSEGAKVVVTPGMVELGRRQADENRAFAAAAAKVADHLIVVGRTNRAALVAGSSQGTASVTVLASREEAVAWVKENLGPGDVVLYENDLPDHYP